MKKIRVTEEGKRFEVYLKFALLEDVDTRHKQLEGVGYAGSFTAARAVHAALYSGDLIELYDEDSGDIELVRPTGRYRRVETVDGKVTHHTLIPRSSSDEDYQKDLNNMIRNGQKEFPERVVLAPKGNIQQVAGQYIAETFGLPRAKDWSDHYLTILGVEKCKRIEVVVTELAGEWKTLSAVKVRSLNEENVLQEIQTAMNQNILKSRSTSLMGEGTFEEDMTTEEYLRQNAELLAKKLDAAMKPLTDGLKFPEAIGELYRLPVPAQARAVSGAMEVLKHKKGVFLVGDMGSGKTQKSLSTVYAYAKNREKTGAENGISVLIVAPSNVVPKWATKEITEIIGRHRVITRIISNTAEALAYVNEIKAGYKVPKGKIEFVLIGTDRMKLASQGFVLGAKWDQHHYVWRSPNTGDPLIKPTRKKGESLEDAIAGWQDAVLKPSKPPTPIEIDEAKKNGMLLPNGLPKGYIKKWKPDVRNFQDDYTSEQPDLSLARPAKKEWAETTGKPRWMIASIFQKHLRNHFHLGIFDEIHQMKASDSGRGVALAKILKSCRKYLFLTGTLTNGASTSIQPILWRAFPGELLREGINYRTSKEQWASRYGVLEKIVTKDDTVKTVGVASNRKNDNVIVKEKPGISPKLVSTFLLDKCIFVELSDLQLPLVEIEEVPVAISLDEEHQDEYQQLHQDLYHTSFSMMKEIGQGAWASFNPTTLNYADQPHRGAEVKFVKDDDVLEVVSAPAFPPSYLTAKERAILNDIEQELREKRRCIVFSNFTGEYQTNERLQKILESKGIESKIMNDSIGVDKRFAWLDEQAAAGVEVLIMNMRLVEVGLDLMDYPTIMFYQMNDDINTVRQASRRSWRLGQHRKCKVYYYFAEKTNQAVQFQRLMSRRVAAMIVEGRIERSDGLAKYADNASGGMVADLSKTLSSVELTNAWRSAAEKDINDNLEIVSEEDFKERIQKTFKVLQNETLKSSGYQDKIDRLTANYDDVEDGLDPVDYVALFKVLEAEQAKESSDQPEEKVEEVMAEKKKPITPIQPIPDELSSRRKTIEMEVEEVNGLEQLDLFNLLG